MSAEIGLDVEVSLAAALGQTAEACNGLAREMRRQAARRLELNQKLMPLEIDLQTIPLTAGAGILDQPRLLGPPMGWTWQIQGIGAQGFTAGTVNTFVNSTGGRSIAPFTVAGVIYQGHIAFIRYGERLLFQASGITGVAQVWLTGLAFTDDIQGEALI